MRTDMHTCMHECGHARTHTRAYAQRRTYLHSDMQHVTYVLGNHILVRRALESLRAYK